MPQRVLSDPPGVWGALTTLSHKEGGANFSFGINERVTMRNAFGLMLMSVLAATLIATGGWFWTSHKSSATPQAFAAAQATPAPVAAKPSASRDPIDITGSIPEKAPAAPARPPEQVCANPHALGVSRVVELDTTCGPGFGFEQFKQIDFLGDKEVV